MHRSKLRRALLGSAATIALMLPFAAVAEDWPGGKWGPHVEFEAKPGTERVIGGAELFLPFWQDNDTLLYGDLRATFDDDDGFEGNAGFGVRQLNGDWILGGYGYFDYRESTYDNDYHHITLGVEGIGEQIEGRLNAYIPLDGEQDVPVLNTVVSGGGAIGVRTGKERALYGMDAEFGFGAPLGDSGDSEVRFFLGGYYFGAEGYDPIAGPRARVELRVHHLDWFGLNSRLTLGAEVQYDDERDAQAFGVARLRIPLQMFVSRKPRLEGLDRRMVDRPVRDVDVVTNTRLTAAETAMFDDHALNGVFFVNEGGSGDGSGDNAANAMDFDTFYGMAGTEGALVVALGDDGDIMTGGATLLDDQVLLGGASSIQLTTMGGAAATFAPGGERPNIVGTGGSDTLTLANNNIVQAIDIEGGDRGIRANGVMGGTVRDVNIADSLLDGVFVNGGATDLSFEMVSIANAGDLGFEANTATNLSLTGVSVDTTVDDGIGLSDVTTLALSDITVSSAGDIGLRINNSTGVTGSMFDIDGGVNDGLQITGSDTVTLSDIDIDDVGDGNGDFGINVNNSMNVTLSSITVDGGTASAINVSGSDMVNVTGATLANIGDTNGDHGVDINNSTNVTFTDTMIDGTFGNGVDLAGVSTSNVTFTNTTVLNAGNFGFSIGNGVDMVNVNDLTVTDAGNHSLRVNNASNVTVDGFTITGGGTAIDINNGVDVTVMNGTATAPGNDGVEISGPDTAGVTIDNVTVTGFTNRGIDISGDGAGSDDIEITNSSFSGAMGSLQGAQINNAIDVLLQNVTLASVGGDGVFINNGATNVTLDTVTVTNPGGINALRINNGTNVSVDDSTFTGGTDTVRLQGTNTVSGTGNTATGFTGMLCDDDSASTTGSISFDTPAGTCP